MGGETAEAIAEQCSTGQSFVWLFNGKGGESCGLVPAEGEDLTYDEFLQQKVAIAESYGFDVALDEIHPLLKDFQKLIVQWAVKGGRRALFEAFGATLLHGLRLVSAPSGAGD